MKCQLCEKPATFHITELTGQSPVEHHLCEICAKSYLADNDSSSPPAPTLAGVLAKQLKIGQAAEELARLDQGLPGLRNLVPRVPHQGTAWLSA